MELSCEFYISIHSIYFAVAIYLTARVACSNKRSRENVIFCDTILQNANRCRLINIGLN